MIRPYQFADYTALLEAFTSNVPNFFAASEVDEFIEFLEQYGDTYLIIEFEHQVVGGVGYEIRKLDQSGRINWIFVHADFTGKGLGKTAVHHCRSILKSHPDVKKLIVRTSQMTAPFFEKFNYKTISVINDYWAKGFDLYEMQQNLTSEKPLY